MSRGEKSRVCAEDIAKRLAADRQNALRLVSVSRETEERLAVYVDLLERWRKTTNLISESTFASFWSRHIADCAQLVALAPGARQWVDMGSGAGLPGLVIAIQLANVRAAVVHCVESDQRKCAFLREVARATGSPARIHAKPIENIEPLGLGVVDAVTARAFATLPETLRLAKVWLEQGAIGVFPRGRSVQCQLNALSPAPPYEIEVSPSAVDPKAGILRIRTI